ncbi:hypothetical protein DFH06DRAFT_109827 [Mycena polygramma]|nr:hypothetical protein DFH06DRAFT_109827 [Mycena polygramma]
MSKSLETFLFNSPGNLPTYLRRLRDAPSLKAIHYKDPMPDWIAEELRKKVEDDPKLQALLTFNPDPPDYLLGRREPANSDGFSSDSDSASDSSSRSVSPAPVQASSRANRVYVENLGELKQVGATRGNTLQYLDVSVELPYGPGSKKPLPAEDAVLLAPFTALTELRWDIDDERVWFSAPPPGYSALPNLQVLKIGSGSPSVLDIGVNLPLGFLRKVHLSTLVDVPAATAFTLCHGPKLVKLAAPLEILIKVNVFDLCPSLKMVVVYPPHMHATAKIAPERKVFPETFITCRTPHTALTKIYFDFEPLHSDHEGPLKHNFEQLNPESFPALKEIQLRCIKWPVSEQAVKKNKWIPLSEILRPKGIKLTDSKGLGGTGIRRRGA